VAAAAAADGVEEHGMTTPHLRAMTLALCLAVLPAAHADKSFATPQAAMEAFGMAVTANDEHALQDMLGPQFRDMIPSVPVADHQRFVEAWAKSHSLQGADDKQARIAVGDDGWTLPIPLVKSAAGWHFDMAAGAEEIRVRRIGRNELAAQQTLLAIYDAQRDYATQSRDESGLVAYAMKLVSTPGKHDGLYWATQAGEPPSPLGPALAKASPPKPAAEGYNGYYYKLLTAQGPHARGGAIDYVVRGRLLGGFAVVAWPVRYWDTGVMTFMVNHDGQVYESDLGAGTAAKAAALKTFDPGPGWQKVAP
jgi:hypothetical protein